jgi:hypothetical protein
MQKAKKQRGGLNSTFAKLASKVGKKMAVRVEGDCCFVPRHSSGTAVFLLNAIGMLLCLYWAYLIVDEGPEDLSFIKVVFATFNSLKIGGGNFDDDETRDRLGSRFSLLVDLAAPVGFLVSFALPLTCCTSGPFEYLTVRRVQGLLGVLVLALCGLEGIAQEAINLELPFLIAYVVGFLSIASVLALRTAAEHFRLDDRGGGNTDGSGGDADFLTAARTPISQNIRRYRLKTQIEAARLYAMCAALMAKKGGDDDEEDTRLRGRQHTKRWAEMSDLESGLKKKRLPTNTNRLMQTSRIPMKKMGDDASGDEVAAAIAANIANWRRNVPADDEQLVKKPQGVVVEDDVVESVVISTGEISKSAVVATVKDSKSAVTPGKDSKSAVLATGDAHNNIGSDVPPGRSTLRKKMGKEEKVVEKEEEAEDEAEEEETEEEEALHPPRRLDSVELNNRRISAAGLRSGGASSTPALSSMMSPLGVSAVHRAELLLSRSKPKAGTLV